jgi:predicted nucleic acid-binding protein
MAGPYTVDASVFLNAFNPHEVGHTGSLQFIARLQEGAVPIVAPTLLLPEVAGAIGRGRRDPNLARRFASTLRRLPHLVLIPLDARLAEQAADLAAQHRLRGSDAVYASVALLFGSTLVTLDQEQRRRLARVLRTRRPEDED